MKKLHEQVGEIATREDLVAFIEALRRDLDANPKDWENPAEHDDGDRRDAGGSALVVSAARITRAAPLVRGSGARFAG